MEDPINNVAQCKQSDDPDSVVRVEPEETAHLTSSESTEFSGRELTHMWHLTLRALRFYDTRGLISPRREGRVRIYSQADSHRIGLILRAKKLGFTLAEIGQLIDAKDGAAPAQDLQLTAEKCLQQIGHLERQMKNIIEALADLRKIHLALCCKVGSRSSEGMSR